LTKLAEGFDAKAAAYVARERGAYAIGIGDDVLPVTPADMKGEGGR
jgi:hypothetical protein